MSPASKVFHAGTHRAVSPAETIARVRPLMPILGITRIANITGLDCIGIPVVTVCRPNARSLAVSQGKGLDLAAAQASGLMESVEFYHAERVLQPLKLASYQELCSAQRVADVAKLPRRRTSRFHRDLPLLWIEGRDLLSDGEPVWVPYEMLQLDMTLPPPTGTGCFLGGSNGLASGNNLLEAISHAICEVVERDASTMFALLDRDGQAARRIDLSTVSDATCRGLLDRYDHADVQVAIWDITSDVGIPAFDCRIVDRSPDPRRALYACGGMGCHPSRRIALARALTEAAQERVSRIAGTRDDLFRSGYEQAQSLEVVRGHLDAIRGGGTRDFRDVTTWEADSFDDDITWELERLRAAGIEEVVAVDLTRRDLQVPVVHVTIAGLEGASWIDEYAAGPRARARARGAA